MSILMVNFGIEAAVVTLNTGKQLEIFDDSGRQTAKIKLMTPVKDDQYLSICVGDLVPSSPGLELGILRKDKYVDIYPLDTSAKSLRRLCYPRLREYANRTSFKLAAADIDPKTPGDELLVLQAPEKDSETQYVYAYSCAVKENQIDRIGYYGLNSKHVPLNAFDVVKSLAWSGGILPVTLTVAKDGYLEMFTPVGDKGVTRRLGTSAFRAKAGIKTLAARFTGHGPAALEEGNILRQYTPTMPPKSEGQIRLKSSSYLIDFAVLPDSGVQMAPPKSVSWRKTATGGFELADWKNLPVSNGRVVSALTPDGTMPVLEINVNKKTSIPLNIKLPVDSNGIGLWLNADQDRRITYVFRYGDKIKKVEAAMVDSPGVTPVSGRFHPYAMYGDWVFWRTYWKRGKGPDALVAIEVDGQYARRVTVGPLAASVSGSIPYQAGNVWKLKNFSMRKMYSTFWTANEYFEYGFDVPAFLRPCIWNKKGLKKLLIEIRPAGGDTFAVYELEGVVLDNPFVLPELPVGCYFIKLYMFGNKDVLIDEKRIVLEELDRSDSPKIVKRLAALPCQVIGIKAGKPVAEVGGKINLELKLSKTIAARTGYCDWQLLDVDGMFIDAGREFTKGQDKIIINKTAGRAGSYILKAGLFSPEGALLYRVTEEFGVAPDKKAQLTKYPGEIAKDKGQTLMLSCSPVIFDIKQTHRLPQYTLPALLSAAIRGGNSPVINLHWHELEPVKGAYNFHLTDRMLDLGALSGKKAWLGVRFAGDQIPEWLWFEELTSQDKRTIHLDYHYINPMGERFDKGHKAIYRALFERYKNDPRVGGWFFFAGPSEGFLTDTWPLICGYSPAAVKRFRLWLEKKYVSIDKLNKEWHRDFKAWNKVVPPQPNWEEEWESSPAWRDFVDFKQDFVVQRLTELQSMLREVDPNRPALMYGKEGFGATGALAPIYRKYNVRYSNGGGETFMAYVQSCIMRNSGVNPTNEGHYVMPNSGSVFAVMANTMLTGNYGGNNIQWGLVWAKRAHDQMPETKMIMHATKVIADEAASLSRTVVAPPKWAGFFSATNSLYTRRQFRLKANDQMKSLHDAGSYILHTPESWVDDYCDQKTLDQFPVLVDTGSEIMRRADVGKLIAYAKTGGTLVAQVNTGKFMPGHEQPVYMLARKLGVTGQKTMRNSTLKADGLVISGAVEPVWKAGADPKELIPGMLWEIPVGKGRVLLSSGDIDFAASSSWLSKTLDKYAGKPPFIIETASLVQSGTVENDKYYYIPVRVLMPNKSTNASIEEMEAEKKVKVTVKAGTTFKPAGIEELIFKAAMTVKGNTLTFEAVPGMLYLIRIRK